MNAINILQSAVETSLAVAALMALVFLLRRPVTRMFGARVAYALWLAPAARLFLPQLNILPPPAPGATLVEAQPLIWATAAPASTQTGPDLVMLGAVLALALWGGVGLVLFCCQLFKQHVFVKRMLDDSAPAPEPIATSAAELARSVNLRLRPEQIRLSHLDTGPLVAGLFRPRIILPSSFYSVYNASERKMALAHEICHIARGDLYAQAMARLVWAAQWPNPLAHFALSAFRRDQEAACDESVLTRNGMNGASAYANAMLKSARTALASNPGLSMGHPLKERIMALKHPRKSARPVAGAVFAAAFCAVGVAATASYGQAPAKSDDEKTEEVLKEKRIMVFAGSEDEVIYDDVVVGDRVKVMEFTDDNGEKRVIRVQDGKKTVQVIGKDGEVLKEEVFDTDGKDVMAWASADGENNFTSANCVAGEGEGEPVMFEWKDDGGDDEHDVKHVTHTVICLTGDDAKPEMRAEALRKAIAQIEENAKREEERRNKMLADMKKKLRELEKEEKKNK